jgi:hypothetical protein
LLNNLIIMQLNIYYFDIDIKPYMIGLILNHIKQRITDKIADS